MGIASLRIEQTPLTTMVMGIARGGCGGCHTPSHIFYLVLSTKSWAVTQIKNEEFGQMDLPLKWRRLTSAKFWNSNKLIIFPGESFSGERTNEKLKKCSRMHQRASEVQNFFRALKPARFLHHGFAKSRWAMTEISYTSKKSWGKSWIMVLQPQEKVPG